MFGKLLWERSRRRAVDQLGRFDTNVEPAMTRFVEQAAQAFAAPVSLLTLIRDAELLVRASTGADLTCLPRGDSFCNHAIDKGDVTEVCDALADSLFRHLPPVVGEPYIRYYIGAPLTLDSGMDVGMLCVLDTAPRSPASSDQRAYLRGLARQAADALQRQSPTRSRFAA